MSSMTLKYLPLPGNVPEIVSKSPQLLTAWEAINAWHQKIVETDGKARLPSNACFIMMACRFTNLHVQRLVKEGSAEKMQGGLIIKKMQEISGELRRFQAVTDWLGTRSSLQCSVEVGNRAYDSLYQQRNQYAAGSPLSKGVLVPVQRLWTMISLMIEIAPEPATVKSGDAKAKLTWLQKQSDDTPKRPLDQGEERDAGSKRAKTDKSAAADAVLGRIEVFDPRDLEIIKRYDDSIGIVPIEGPVKNRSVVTAYDVLTLGPRQELNDVVIDAHLTLVCHTFNKLFEEGIELPRSPRYHAWSAQMSNYLQSRVGKFEDRHLRQEWPPARFVHAALEDTHCHIFPVHVGGNHWVLMVLQKTEGQWSLFCYSSLPGYDRSFEAPWQTISSWLFFKSKGAFDVRNLRGIVPNPQPTQDNMVDCGVFVCGIVRWTLEGWDLSTLNSRIINHYRRRMTLEIERWSLSTN